MSNKKEFSNINNKSYKLESAKKERELHRSIKLNKKRELKVGKLKKGEGLLGGLGSNTTISLILRKSPKQRIPRPSTIFFFPLPRM